MCFFSLHFSFFLSYLPLVVVVFLWFFFLARAFLAVLSEHRDVNLTSLLLTPVIANDIKCALGAKNETAKRFFV